MRARHINSSGSPLGGALTADLTFALGSYSTIWHQTTKSHFADLGEPVAPRLLFAGEATGAARHGYVDGAIDTGVREATRILGTDRRLDLAATFVG